MQFNNKFKLIGFTSDPAVLAIVMILSTGKTITMEVSELVDSEISNDLNRNEIKALYKKLYSKTNIKTAYEFTDRHEKSWNAYFISIIALSVIYIFSTIGGIKPFYIPFTKIVTTPGTFIYPITFLLVDILNEFYGLRLARRAILISFIANLFLVLGLWITTLTPDVSGWKFVGVYDDIVNGILSVLLASSTAYLVSENINSYLLCKIKELTNSKYLFIRVMTSTVIASAFDTVIFCFIAFYGVLGIEIIKEMIIYQFIIKVMYAMSGVAPIYLIRKIFNNFINSHVQVNTEIVKVEKKPDDAKNKF